MNTEKIINNNIKIDKDNYYKLVDLYGKEKLSTIIDNYIKEKLKKDFSLENQTRLWDRFGYYLACQEHSIFEEVSISKISKKGNRYRDFTLEEEKKWGYLLLIKPYIEVLDENNKICIEKIFASIDNIETRDYILNRLDYMYNNITRVSYQDDEIKNFINNYKKMCINCELPKVDYVGELIENRQLLDQIDMYVRFSIAYDKMLIGNLAIIDKVIKNREYLLEEYDYNELYQNGYFGLVRAVENYDIRYGNTFLMSASRWIISYIFKNFKFDMFSANISFGLMRLINQINVEDELALITTGRNLTDEELALNLGVSDLKIKEARLVVKQYKKLYLEGITLDESKSYDDYTWEDLVRDDTDYISRVENCDLYLYVSKLMEEKLTPKEKEILLMRANDMTLNNIGNVKGISYERVRQLEERGLNKIRRNSGIRKLLNKQKTTN